MTKPRDQAAHRNGDVSRADDGEGPAASDGTGPGQPKGRTTGDLLLSLVGDLRIFKSPEGNTYASVSSAGRTENLRIRSSGFSSWLAWEFYMRYRKPPGENSIKSAIGLLDAKARFDAPTLPVFVRVAERDGKLYIDLLNAARQVVEVTPGAWRVLDACPVQFLRTRAMLPLPEPRSGGSLDAIRPLVNLRSDPDWLLLAALLTYYLRSSSPFPIMVLQGEQGCAKSTTARIVRSLVDPNAVDLRSEPRGEQDLIISASNAWLVVLDNISKIPPWLSDALCRLATGGGFSKRALYTDDDEALFKVARPIVLNGITEFIGLT